MIIYAPNLHLFTFVPVQFLDSNLQTTDNSEDILKLFRENYLKLLKPIFNDISSQELQLNVNLNSPSLLANRKKFQTIKQAKFPQKAVIYPFQFGDSYTFNLSLFRPQEYGKDSVKIEDLKAFNPDNCLDVDISANFGKIILFTALIEESQKSQLNKLQKECLEAIFPLEKTPNFYTKQTIFNSDVFIYGNPKSRDLEQSFKQVWLIFFTSAEELKKFESIFFELPELFLYFHKIVNAFHLGKKQYQFADKIIDSFGQILKDIKQEYGLNPLNQDALPPIDLDILKSQLKNLLTKNLKFSEIVRKLEIEKNTLDINIYNYQKSCEQLAIKTNNDLSLFTSFTTREFAGFSKEILANINYTSQGSLLIQEAVSTIRALIELDQAQSDRQAQQLKEKSDRQLQITLTAIGAGIAVGGIIASTSGQVTKDNPLYMPWQQSASHQLHPVVWSVIISIAGAAIASILAFVLVKYFYYLREKKGQKTKSKG